MTFSSLLKVANIVRAALAVVIMGIPWPLHAADFLIQLNAAMSDAERTSLQKAVKAEVVKPVSSLGHGVEIWRSSVAAESVHRTFEGNFLVSIHDTITGDYRDLFADLDPTMDLAPDVAKNLAAVRQRSTTAEVRAVRVKPDTLTTRILVNGFDQTDGFASSGTVRLNLFPNANVVAVRQKLTQHDANANTFDWTGVVTRMANDPLPIGRPSTRLDSTIPKGIAALSVDNGNIIGRVNVGADTYTITPLGKGFHAITRLDPKKFPPDHPPSEKELEKVKPVFNVRGDAAARKKVLLTNADGSVNDIAPSPIITVGVAYTKGAANLLGAISPQQFANALVNITNVSYGNSGVQAALSLAGVTVTQYAESDWDKDIELLKHPTDGSFTDIHKWRHDVGANVVVLVVTLDSYCGLAGNILAGVDDAYALVSQGCALDNLSFAHEIGHLQGARHNETADPTDVPFPYGHGYRYKSEWRTIMAYDCDVACNRLPYWANPNVKLNGVPMGTINRNHDARVLTETADRVHNLKP